MSINKVSIKEVKNNDVIVWSNKSDINENIDKNKLVEDLAVWFGTKKKPKGSKQPKGPWVNICRKKEGGGHPPCGRDNAGKGAYPKCRAAGVAGKMTDIFGKLSVLMISCLSSRAKRSIPVHTLSISP